MIWVPKHSKRRLENEAKEDFLGRRENFLHELAKLSEKWDCQIVPRIEPYRLALDVLDLRVKEAPINPSKKKK